jgi:hypothetical protein
LEELTEFLNRIGEIVLLGIVNICRRVWRGGAHLRDHREDLPVLLRGELVISHDARPSNSKMPAHVVAAVASSTSQGSRSPPRFVNRRISLHASSLAPLAGIEPSTMPSKTFSEIRRGVIPMKGDTTGATTAKGAATATGAAAGDGTTTGAFRFRPAPGRFPPLPQGFDCCVSIQSSSLISEINQKLGKKSLNAAMSGHWSAKPRGFYAPWRAHVTISSTFLYI